MKYIGVDKTTEINYICINIEDTKEQLMAMRKQAEIDGLNDPDKGVKYLTISDDNYSFNTEEYYFDENTNELQITGELTSVVGTTNICLSIPLSDIVLIDILQYSIKKLNKLKTALETLK